TTKRSRWARVAVVCTLLVAVPFAACSADCGNDASGFEPWLSRFKTRAAGQGISSRAINAALAGVSYDANVVRLDRSQRSFKLSFEQFYARRVSSTLLRNGQRLMQTHKQTLDRIESRFGVPGSNL